MDISFLSPGFLLLLLGIPALWFFPRRVNDPMQGALRSLLFACVVLALARPVLLAKDEAQFQVLILDRSSSVSVEQQHRALVLANKWLDRVEDKEKASIIIIGEESAEQGIDSGDKAEGGIAALSRAGTVLRIGQTDTALSSSPLSAALAAAQRQIPVDSPGAITLLSDGLSTDRRWGPVVQALIQRGIAVNTADLRQDESDIYPAGLITEPAMRAGQTAHIEVPVIGKATGIQARLLDAQGKQLALSEPTDSADGRVSIPMEFEPRAEGFMKIRVELIAASKDANTDNNTFEKTVAIQAPIRLLYLGERMQRGAARLGDLLGHGFKIEDGSNLDLRTVPDFKNYDLVMLDDRSAKLLPEQFQVALSKAVSLQGLGLVFSGGKSSFGTGGYDQTTIAKVLPVEFAQHTEKRDPSTAVALIIDTSGSMMGTRMELAKQVSRLAIRRLKAHDRIGIVEFYGNKHWALPMQSAANKIAVERAIGRMQADGGTVLYPAIEEAYYGLKNMATRYKHILIITDAGIEDSNYKELVARVADDHINVSTVLVGEAAHDQQLIDFASWGKGRFYYASDRYALPEVIFKQPSTMKLPAYKTGSFEIDSRGGEGWWSTIDRAAIPALAGYVETRGRPGAEVLMEIKGNAHPLLSSWRYGLGRVTALMTEPVGEGTQSWQNWRDYGRMLARIVSRTADDTQAFRYTVERDDRRIVLTARRCSEIAGLAPQASVQDEQGQDMFAAPFRQIAPDYFVSEWTADAGTEVRINARIKDLDADALAQSRTRLVSSAAEDVSPERQVDIATAVDMAALAQSTSGMTIDVQNPGDAVFTSSPRSDQSSLHLFKLWPYALLLALLLYLGELTYRRWPAS